MSKLAREVGLPKSKIGSRWNNLNHESGSNCLNSPKLGPTAPGRVSAAVT